MARTIDLTPEQAIRDLEWVLNSPSLIDDPQAVGAIRLDHECNQVFDCNSLSGAQLNELAQFCERGVEHKVGRYFEDLVGFWLQHLRQVEMVGQGIQVRDEKRTIGEIDFLFRDENGLLTHLEVAAKFYLHNPDSHEVSDFPGPNATDNFERKSDKLFNDQLALSIQHYPEVKQRLALVRGTLFYHPSILRPKELPSRMSAKHAEGVWIRASELNLLDIFSSGVIAPKPFWFSSLAPVREVACEVKPVVELKSELRDHFAENAYPVMVSLAGSEGGSTAERFFVVSDSWPN